MNKTVVICDRCHLEADRQNEILSMPVNWFHLAKKVQTGSIGSFTEHKHWDFCSLPCLFGWVTDQRLAAAGSETVPPPAPGQPPPSETAPPPPETPLWGRKPAASGPP